MATFYNYRYEKVYWFITYLLLAEAICKDPSLSVHNSSFKDHLEEYYGKVDRLEKDISGFYGSTKTGMGL